MQKFLFVVNVIFGLLVPMLAQSIDLSMSGVSLITSQKTILGNEGLVINLAVNGDFNNDGVTDTAVCIPYYDTLVLGLGKKLDSTPFLEGEITKLKKLETNNTAGAVFIFTSTLSKDMLLSDADIVLRGEAEGDQAGGDCAVGDFNGDDIDDLWVIANTIQTQYVVFGSSSLTSGSLGSHTEVLAEPDTVSYSGFYSVANAGDVNADGYDDALIGEQWNDSVGTNGGAMYLVLGGTTLISDLSSAVKYTGEASNDYAGTTVSGAGDVNSDGFDDILTVASFNGTGAAYLILGSASPASASLSTVVKYVCEGTSSYGCSDVAGAGDVNGDGYADIVVGNSIDSSYIGAAYLVLGNASPSSANLSTMIKFTGETTGDNAGSHVSGAGDVNADGFSDFLVSADKTDVGASNAGSVYLVLGKTSLASGTLAPSRTVRKFIGKAASDAAGSFIGPAAKQKNASFFIGANLNDDNGDGAGQIWFLDKNSLPGINLSDPGMNWTKILP